MHKKNINNSIMLALFIALVIPACHNRKSEKAPALDSAKINLADNPVQGLQTDAEVGKELDKVSKNEMEKLKKLHFKSLNGLSIGKLFFNTDSIDTDGYIVWKPDSTEFEHAWFSPPYRGYYSTMFRRILYYTVKDDGIDTNKGVVIFETPYRNEEGVFMGCHSCVAILSYAVFSKSDNAMWQLQSYNKELSAGLWGAAPEINSLIQTGSQTYAFELSGTYMQQGFIEKWLRFYDFENERDLFMLNAEPVDDLSDLTASFRKSPKKYWDVLVKRKKIDNQDYSKRKKSEWMIYDEESEQYILKEN